MLHRPTGCVAGGFAISAHSSASGTSRSPVHHHPGRDRLDPGTVAALRMSCLRALRAARPTSSRRCAQVTGRRVADLVP